MASSEASSGPPYLPNTAGVGGRPVVHIDIPILSVFLLFYVTGAVSSMTILQLNRRKGHKFLINGAMFGFCMSRIVTCIMRIVWTTRPHNARIAIAAQIFTNAGVLILYVIALLLALRMFRATQPRLGWNKGLARALKGTYVSLGLALALVIAFTVLSFYTLNHKLKTASLWIQRAAILYMLIFNLIGTVLYFLALLLPRSPQWENFGNSSMRTKFIILGSVIFFVDFIAGFRTGTIWAAPRPATNPAWFHTKEAFYIIELGFEVVVLYILLITRIDKKFWVPNGSNGPGDFSRAGQVEKKTSTESFSSGKASSGAETKV